MAKRRVFESGVWGVMLTSRRSSGPRCGEATAGAVPADAGTRSVEGSDFTLTIGALAGRRMIRVSVATQIKDMKPIIVPSYRLLGAGGAVGAAILCTTMLRPA